MSSGLWVLIGQPLPSRKDTTKVVTRLKMYFILLHNNNIGACAVQVPRGQVVLALLTAHYPTGTVTPPSFSFLAVVLLLSLLICVANRFSSHCLASVQVIGGIITMNRVFREHLAAKIKHSPGLIESHHCHHFRRILWPRDCRTHDTGSEGSLYHAHPPVECCLHHFFCLRGQLSEYPGCQHTEYTHLAFTVPTELIQLVSRYTFARLPPRPPVRQVSRIFAGRTAT